MEHTPPTTELPAAPSIGEMLRAHADSRADHPFLVFGDQSWGYGRVARQVRSLAASLHNLGVEPGDRIALTLPNWPELVIASVAAAEVGATIVPLNPSYRERELQYMLRNSEASVAVTAERRDGVDYLQLFESMMPELPGLQYLITVGDDDLWYDDRIFQFEDLVATGRGSGFQREEVDGDEPFALLYTPGTAGAPKGVVLSYDNLLLTARATAKALDLTPGDVTLCAVPLYHIFGLSAALMTTLVSGGTLVLQDEFSAPETLDLAQRHGATVLHGVPTMFVMLLRELEAGRSPDGLRTGIIAGAPVEETLVQEVRERLIPDVEIAYGMTETSPTVSITRPDDPPAKRAQTVGRPLDGVELEVRDGEGNPLPRESVGELAIRGFNVMKGYFRQPHLTGEVLGPDGFLQTGDLAMIDPEGYLHIVGRKSDVIIRGGYNVQPREIEDLLRSHPAVTDATVIGIPNEVLGELIGAAVLLAEGALITTEELRDYCSDSLADYKVPDTFQLVDTFPDAPTEAERRLELARALRAGATSGER